MGHFSHYVHRHRVSEWQSEYVHYTLLRQQLRQLKRARAGAKPATGRSATASPGSDVGSQDAPFSGIAVELVAAKDADSTTRLVHEQPRLRHQVKAQAQLQDDSDSDIDDSDHEELPGDENHECQQLDLDAKLDKHRQQYHQHALSPLTPPSTDDRRHYDVHRLHDYPPLSSLLPSYTPQLPHEQHFLDTLDLDLSNVNTFFMSQQHYLDEHFELLSKQAETLRLQTTQQQHGTSLLDQQHQELDRSFRELYRGQLMVRQYRELNYRIVLKVLAQYDRVSNFNATAACMPYVHRMYCFTSPILDELIIESEHVYAEFVEQHERRAAMQQLRAPVERVTPLTYLLLGTSVGITVCLIIIIAIMPGFIAGRRISLHGALLASIPVWKMLGVVVLELYSYALLLYILQRYQINYCYIMEITQHERHQLRWPTVLAIAASVSCIWTTALGVYIFLLACVDSGALDAATFNPNYVPLILFCLMLGLIFNPAPIFYWSARRQLLVQLFNVVIAPFGSISFATQSLAEQLTSYALPITDLFRCFAFFFTGDFLSANSTTWKTAIDHDAIWIVAMLPFMWRALQCVRLSYLNEGWTNKINAAKYSTSMLNNIGRYSYELLGQSYRPMWITFATIAFVFNTSWDVKMDWGLVENKNAETEKSYTNGWGEKKVVRSHDVSVADFLTEQMKQEQLAKYYKSDGKDQTDDASEQSSKDDDEQPAESSEQQQYDWRLWRQYQFVRSRTLFPRPVYYLAVAVDTLLRISWYYLLGSNNYPTYLNKAYLEAIVACFESVRRNIWNVLRLEREHLSNLNTLSAIKVTPPDVKVDATYGECRHVQPRTAQLAAKDGIVVNWHL